MIYELREYYVAPGKGAALHQRFQEHTLGFFEKHGIKVLGFWNVVIGDGPKVVYLCQYADLAARERAWDGFSQDPGWLKARSDSEKDGGLTTRTVSTILSPTAYSELK